MSRSHYPEGVPGGRIPPECSLSGSGDSGRPLWTAVYHGLLHPGEPGTPQHDGRRKHWSRALRSRGPGQALAPECHLPGQDRDYGDIGHISIPSGQQMLPGRVKITGIWFSNPYSSFFP